MASILRFSLRSEANMEIEIESKIGSDRSLENSNKLCSHRISREERTEAASSLPVYESPQSNISIMSNY